MASLCKPVYVRACKILNLKEVNLKVITVLTLILASFLCLAQDDLILGEWSISDENSNLSFTFNESSEVTIVYQDSSEQSTYTGIWYLDESYLYIGLDSGEELFYDVISLNESELVLTDETSDQLYFARTDSSASPLTPPDTQAKLPSPSVNSETAPNATPIPTPTGLIGKWTYLHEEEFLSSEETLYFLPEGRYFAVTSSQVPGYDKERSQEEGLYVVEGETLFLTPYCSEQKSLPIQLVGSELILTGQDLYGEQTEYRYTFEPGSNLSVIPEIEAVDAERDQNNQPYLARTPIGPAQMGSVSVTGLPVDPNPNKVNPNIQVFTEGELYTYLSSWTYVFDIYGQLQTVNATDIALNTPKMNTLNYSKGSYRDTSQWFFLPNGRFYAQTDLYALANSTEPLTPQTTSFWGNYEIKGNTLVLEEDAGAISNYQLLDGRRVLAAGSICYNEVEWATEALGQ